MATNFVSKIDLKYRLAHKKNKKTKATAMQGKGKQITLLNLRGGGGRKEPINNN